MAFPVPGQLAFNGAEFFQILERHSVKGVLGAQRVNAVFCVAGIVDEIVPLMPRPVFFRKHHPVNRGHDFCQGRRATPMASRPADHGMGVHQGHECPGHYGIRQDNFLPGQVAHFDRIFRALLRSRRQAVGNVEGAQRRRLHGLNGSDFSSHG